MPEAQADFADLLNVVQILETIKSFQVEEALAVKLELQNLSAELRNLRLLQERILGKHINGELDQCTLHAPKNGRDDTFLTTKSMQQSQEEDISRSRTDTANCNTTVYSGISFDSLKIQGPHSLGRKDSHQLTELEGVLDFSQVWLKAQGNPRPLFE
jgi:hypothetical protein